MPPAGSRDPNWANAWRGRGRGRLNVGGPGLQDGPKQAPNEACCRQHVREHPASPHQPRTHCADRRSAGRWEGSGQVSAGACGPAVAKVATERAAVQAPPPLPCLRLRLSSGCRTRRQQGGSRPSRRRRLLPPGGLCRQRRRRRLGAPRGPPRPRDVARDCVAPRAAAGRRRRYTTLQRGRAKPPTRQPLPPWLLGVGRWDARRKLEGRMGGDRQGRQQKNQMRPGGQVFSCSEPLL